MARRDVASHSVGLCGMVWWVGRGKAGGESRRLSLGRCQVTFSLKDSSLYFSASYLRVHQFTLEWLSISQQLRLLADSHEVLFEHFYHTAAVALVALDSRAAQAA